MAKSYQYLIITLLILLSAGCASTRPAAKKDCPNAPPTASATFYTVKGKTYYPLKEVRAGHSQSGVASWYGPGFHGKKTASGEVYNMHALSAAHNTLPLNSVVKVTNQQNNRSVVVRVNDRGPFVGDRVIDLSMGAARELGMVRPGVVPVKIVVVRGPDSKVVSRLQARSEKTTQSQPPNPFFAGKSKGLLAFIAGAR